MSKNNTFVFNELPTPITNYIATTIKNKKDTDQRIYYDYFECIGPVSLSKWAKAISELYYTFDNEEVEKLFFPFLFGEQNNA